MDLGRPDMALFGYKSHNIWRAGNVIRMQRRDFTYIDDVIESVIQIIYQPARTDPNWSSDAPQPEPVPAMATL